MAGTSQATLSAYERGLKSPSMRVASRILAAMDLEFTVRAHVDWVEHHPHGIVEFWVPDRLWRVEPPGCFATLYLPDLIHDPPEQLYWNMRVRDERRGAYEQLIRRGIPHQMLRWLDGGFLVDLWDELDLPDPVRRAWAPALRRATKPLKEDGLRFVLDDFSDVQANARIRGYKTLPESTAPQMPRRTRFDPRPPP